MSNQIKTATKTARALTAGNDLHNGTDAADTFDGNTGNDTIFGFAGNDAIAGSDGNDKLDGGVGHDTVLGGAGNDALLGDAGNDSLDGGDGNDTLDGGAGKDTLIGGLGADNLSGGTEDDFYIADNIGDKVIETAGSAGGVDTVQSSLKFTLANKPAVENLILTGNANNSATGNDLNNKLTGNSGNNLLTGKGGADILTGGSGDDILDGGSGIDKLIGGDGSDTYRLSNQEDSIVETAEDADQDQVETTISFSLMKNIEVLRLLGKSDINGEGNTQANRLEGNNGNNNLSGGGGDDTLLGGSGDDILDGGTGDNTLDGGTGNDTAVFANAQGNYKLSEDTVDGVITVEDADSGAKTELTNIETLLFADGELDVSNGLAQTLTLSVNDIELTEGNSGNKTAIFTLRLSEATSAPVSVAYTTVDGDALAGQDYQASTGTVTFAADETSKTVAITVTGDTQVEDDEQFFLQLSPPGSVTMDNFEAGATLLNDDKPLLSITGATTLEGNNGKTGASLTVTLSAPVQQEVTVDYATANGVAGAGTDYIATTGQLSFAAGETSKTIPVSVLGDTLVEGNETFRVVLSKPVNASLGGSSSATVTITDDDAIVLPTLTIADATFAEGNSGSSNATVTITLSAASTKTVSVNYAATNGSATSGSDYTATTGSVTFAAGETSKTITVPVLGDTTPEANETLTVALSAPSNATLGAASSATITITNDDLPTLAIAGATVTEGNSGSSNATLTVSLSAASASPVTVNYTTADGTASNGSDYTATTGSLTFAAGETSKTVTVPILGDTTPETNETLTVALASPGNATLAAASSATVTINDDDLPSLAVAGATLAEGNSGSSNATVTITLSAASTKTVSVNYATANGSATSGSDYTATTGQVTFAAGETSKTITVPVLGDTTPEANETLTVALTSPSNATLGAVSSATITITNDDLPTLAIAGATVTEGNSGSSNATLTVSLSAASASPVTVNYATADGTASNGSDYTATTGSLTFAAGETSKTVTVPVLGDTTPETNETLTVALASPSNATLAAASSATVTINDDDLPSLAIAGATVTEGNSGSSNATVTITLSAASTKTVSVNYATTNGSAISGSDYTTTTGSVTFAAGETSKTITIPVLGDTTPEANETLTVALASPSNATLGAVSSATITITNDDLPTLAIAGATVTEGNSGSSNATLTVSLSAASASPVTVNYTTADGTASNGSDYTATTGSLTFAAGETSKTITVPVLGDTTVEPDETFSVSLSSPTNAALSASSSAVVTVSNDDLPPAPVTPTVAMMTATQIVSEGNSGSSNATVTVTLLAATTQVVSVNYATADGTALAGSDYTAVSGVLTFTPAETSKTITVPIAGDTSVESDETLTVALSAPVNGLLGAVSSTQITISNDDAPPAQPTITTSAAQIVNEGNSGSSNATVTVSLSASSTQTVTVNYATANGTALAGADYTAASGVLTFAPGETSKTIAVPVIGDTVVEGDETLTLALSAPVNGLLGAVSSTQVTIKNDDAATPGGVVFDGLDMSLSDAANTVTGTAVNDRILALGGNDTVDGAAGHDYLDGGDGHDSLTGGEGKDSLYGGLGDDTLDGYDTITTSADSLEGGEGNDTLYGDESDTLTGGAGDDYLEGYSPWLYAGDGNDEIYCRYSAGAVITLQGGAGNDRIDFSGNAAFLDGGTGDDYLLSGSGNGNTLVGGAGNDTITGNSYSAGDSLDGGDGNDVIDAGYGNDTLTGGAGNDSLAGSYGNDTINGGSGVDNLAGGGEDDFFVFAAGDSGVGSGSRDIISDFDLASSLEVIDLSAVAAGVLAYQDAAPFSAADQIRYSFDLALNTTIVQINLDSNTATTEMEIELTGLLGLSAADFVA